MGIGWVQLLIVLGIVILIFGTKKLRNIGGDLGGAIKSFKTSMKGEKGEKGENDESDKVEHKSGSVIEGEVTKKKEEKSS